MPAVTARPARLLPLAPLALLLPFLGKALHVDDPLFMAYAAGLRASPAHPFQVPLYWGGHALNGMTLPNPPLWPYLLAAAGSVLGPVEWRLHLLTLAFAALALGALALLARRLDVPPAAATLLFGGSSAFLCLGSTVMPDVPLTACALAGLALGVRGVDEGRWRDAVASGLFLSAAFLLRYNALPVVACVALYALMAGRGRGRGLVPAALAGAAAVAWELSTGHVSTTLRGWGLQRGPLDLALYGYLALAHIGSQLPPLGLTPLAVVVAEGRRGLWLCALALVGALGLEWTLRDAPSAWLAVVFAWPGLTVLAWAALVLVRALGRRLRAPDAASALRWMLAAWLLVTPFSIVRYIHVASKYMLLPVTAAVLLLLDGLRRAPSARQNAARAVLALALAATPVLGLLVAVSDYRFAGLYRRLPADGRLALPPDGIGYVNADWGLGYYAQRAGWRRYRGQVLGPRDLLLHTVVVAGALPPSGPVEVVTHFDVTYPGPFAVLNQPAGAGFWSNGWGPFPYVPDLHPGDTVILQRGR